MSEDSPKIVSLETPLELSDFPSEAEFASEAQVAPVAPAPASTAAAVAAPPVPSPVAPAAETPRHVERPSIVSPAAASVTEMPVGSARESRTEPEDVVEHLRQLAHIGPAVVTEFPVKPQTPAAVALPTLPPGPVSLVELIERRGGFDWREAVAVIQQICLYLRDHSQQTPILLDPRTIQITERGEVRLLSGQTSSDPLVIQVGRLLRTMLMGKEAPPELRLLLSQATFELPIFESVEDVDRALAQLNKLDEPGPAGLALLRAVAAPPPPPDPDQDFDQRPPPIRSILPASRMAERRGKTRGDLRSLVGSYGSHVAVIFAAISVIALLLATRPPALFPMDAPSTVSAQPAPIDDTSVSAATTPAVSPQSSREGSSVPAAGQSRSAPPSGEDLRRPQPPAHERSDAFVGTPSGERATPEPSPRPGSNGPRPGTRLPDPTPTAGIVIEPRRPAAAAPSAPVSTASAREAERRAREYLEGGKRAEASLEFDALVMRNPLYEPRRTDLTPEALEAFQRSQRLILPVKAQSNYDRAKAAMAAGDFDTALALAKETLAILDRHSDGTSPDLRPQTEDLIDEARLAAASVNEVIYSEEDRDVTPPRQLSRPMPVNGPIGVPPNRVGWLDMVIGKDGTVVQVKLHTPLNRHHERMIVSPAKAWLFRPATKNGKPVLYRIKVKVNLPESGTDF